ncbi:hypothetical protein Tco_0755383 [Tanacetum coccineum]
MKGNTFIDKRNSYRLERGRKNFSKIYKKSAKGILSSNISVDISREHKLRLGDSICISNSIFSTFSCLNTLINISLWHWNIGPKQTLALEFSKSISLTEVKKKLRQYGIAFRDFFIVSKKSLLIRLEAQGYSKTLTPAEKESDWHNESLKESNKMSREALELVAQMMELDKQFVTKGDRISIQSFLEIYFFGDFIQSISLKKYFFPTNVHAEDNNNDQAAICILFDKMNLTFLLVTGFSKAFSDVVEQCTYALILAKKNSTSGGIQFPRGTVRGVYLASCAQSNVDVDTSLKVLRASSTNKNNVVTSNPGSSYELLKKGIADSKGKAGKLVNFQ